MAAEWAAPLTGGRGTYREYVRMLLGPDVTTLKETNTSAAITYRLTALEVWLEESCNGLWNVGQERVVHEKTLKTALHGKPEMGNHA